jgi:hypothetical protein
MEVLGMKLGSVLKTFVDEVGWKEQIEVGDDGNVARVMVKFGIENQPYPLFLETDERAEIFTITVVSPLNVPPARMADMARILNRLNCGIRTGRLWCYDDEDSNNVCYQQAIDMEGTKLVPMQIHNLISAAISTFKGRATLLAAVALTQQPIDALWAEYVEQDAGQQETSAAEEEQAGPTEL